MAKIAAADRKHVFKLTAVALQRKKQELGVLK